MYKSYTENSTLTLHINQAHLGKGIQCPTCNKSFLTNHNLSQHQTQHHSDQKPHKCDTCDATFRVKSNMIRHKKTWHNRVFFTCENCTLSFRSPVTLSRHRKLCDADEELKDFKSRRNIDIVL